MRAATALLVHVLLLLAPAAPAADDAAPALAPLAGRYVIDVRSAREWADGHIEGAAHVPHDLIAERIRALVPDRDAPIALYCASGGRSALARDILAAMRYTNVVNWGGITEARARVAAAGECDPAASC